MTKAGAVVSFAAMCLVLILSGVSGAPAKVASSGAKKASAKGRAADPKEPHKPPRPQTLPPNVLPPALPAKPPHDNHSEPPHPPSNHSEPPHPPSDHSEPPHPPSNHSEPPHPPSNHSEPPHPPSNHSEPPHPPSNHSEPPHPPSNHSEPPHPPSNHSEPPHPPSSHSEPPHPPAKRSWPPQPSPSQSISTSPPPLPKFAGEGMFFQQSPKKLTVLNFAKKGKGKHNHNSTKGGHKKKKGKGSSGSSGGTKNYFQNSSNSWDQSLSDWFPATATCYGGADGSGTMGGSCGFGDLMADKIGMNNAALSQYLYGPGTHCGACFEIQCAQVFHNGVCSNGSIFVTATNLCPDTSYGGWCQSPNYHFDLSCPMWTSIASPASAGVAHVQARLVQCQRSGGVGITVQGNPFWADFKIFNVGGSGELAVVEVSTDGGQTFNKANLNYGVHWSLGAAMGGKALTFRLTDTLQNVVTLYNVFPSNWAVGGTYWANGNF